MIQMLFKMAMRLYAYCTDFTINVSNLLGISYYETNAWLFCIIWPAVTFMLMAAYMVQRRRLRKLQAPVKTVRH